MNARVLHAESGSTVEARLGDYLGAAEAARAASFLDSAAIVIDGAPAAAEIVANAIRQRGGFARVAGRQLVVAATHQSIAAIAAELAGAQAEHASSAHAVVSELLRALAAESTPPSHLRLRDRSLDLVERPRIMGILNVTPDSFYDRGRYAALDRARERAAELAALGADIIDVGGQSYSGAVKPIDESEERRRVIPVVAALVRDGLDVALSVDTVKSSVAERALDAGAHLINDCSGMKDPGLAAAVARYDAALVIMHLQGELNVRAATYHYDDALAEIGNFLREGLARARAAGIRADSLVADPGLEFGKEPATDLEILARFGELRSLGVPTLLAASRKSFIGRVFDRPANALLVPSLAAVAAGVLAGASLVRVHDVAETLALVTMLAALRTPNRSGYDAGHPRLASADARKTSTARASAAART